jgi:uncharacterized protein
LCIIKDDNKVVLTGDYFIVKSELEKLVELQITDTKIRILKKAINTADTRRAEIEQEFEQHASSIREIQNQATTAKAEKAKTENEIAEAQAKLQRADRNLKNAQNQKEYEAAMREMDVLQKELSVLETKDLEQIEAIEEIEKVLTERAEEIAGIEGKRDKALKDFEDELKKSEAEFKIEQGKRDKVFPTLPKNLASVYDRMAQRSRDGIAVAEVKNSSCSACFMKLRPQVVLELKMTDKIMTCESCARILYILTSKDAVTT